MRVTVLASREEFERALREASRRDVTPEMTKLTAALDAAVLGRIDEAWSSVENAMRVAFERGKAIARPALDKALAFVDQVVTTAGVRAREIQEALLLRMQQFVLRITQSVLSRVPTTMRVGDATLKLAHVQYSHRLMLGGALSTNIEELFSLSAEGEIVIEANYAA